MAAYDLRSLQRRDQAAHAPVQRGPDPLPDRRGGGGRHGPYATLRDYADVYRNGGTTPLAVTEQVLAAISQSEAATPPLRSFIANDREDALGRVARDDQGRD